MKNKYFFFKVSILFALSYWMFDSLIHYLVYGEFEFELIPSDSNEIWMRCMIFILLVAFGLFSDYHTNKIIKKDLEKQDVYIAMFGATKHILNNFLQGMKLFREIAKDSKDIDENVLKLYDSTINNAVEQINNLDDIKDPNKETIEQRYLPK